jgi:hypothetical protein
MGPATKSEEGTLLCRGLCGRGGSDGAGAGEAGKPRAKEQVVYGLGVGGAARDVN